MCESLSQSVSQSILHEIPSRTGAV